MLFNSETKQAINYTKYKISVIIIPLLAYSYKIFQEPEAITKKLASRCPVNLKGFSKVLQQKLHWEALYSLYSLVISSTQKFMLRHIF